MTKRTSCEICAGQSEPSASQTHDGDADQPSRECCEQVREEVARLRACMTRAWLLLARGCGERALQGFADLYELAAGVSDKAWAKTCCGAHEVVCSLCYVLDRGECTDTKVLAAVSEHIDALEETACKRADSDHECGLGALRMRLRLSRMRAGLEQPAASISQGRDDLGNDPASMARRVGTPF